MDRSILQLRIDKNVMVTSESIRDSVLKDKELTFFQIHTSSLNSWHCFVYQMGLIKINQEFEKFKKNLEKE